MGGWNNAQFVGLMGGRTDEQFPMLYLQLSSELNDNSSPMRCECRHDDVFFSFSRDICVQEDLSIEPTYSDLLSRMR